MPKAMTRAMGLPFAKTAWNIVREAHRRAGRDEREIRPLQVACVALALRAAHAAAEADEVRRLGDAALAGRIAAIGR